MISSDISTDIAKGPTRPATVRRLLLLCAVSLGAGIGAANWLEFRGSSSYAGTLQSRTTAITSARSARIQEIAFIPGQRVVPGDRVLELVDDRLTVQIVDKQRELVELEAELKRVKAVADVELEWRRRELNGEIFQTQIKLSSVSQERIARQVEQLAWQEHLTNMPRDRGPDLVEAIQTARSVIVDSPFPDERKLQAMLREDAAAAAAESLAAQQALCEERLERLRKLDGELPGKIRVSAGVDVVETRLTRGRDELKALEQQRASLTVLSPAHGIVGTICREPGDIVQPGDVILELIDDARRHLVAYIPSADATRLKPGTKVNLVFPAAQQRIGLVAAIPPHAIPAEASARNQDSQVAVRIEPAGKLWPKLPVGSRVQVQVPQ
jgi:multidrug resistance efflux pump